jgi:signal transduction histidine kinase
VRCIPGEINQVILNILVNAAQAIEESLPDPPDRKGTITVRTRLQDKRVHIIVGDSGKGIPEELQTRIFDPFFTTKDVGKGTGQGLTIAYNIIVNRHGGKLYFESTPEQGTAFHILLPVNGCDPADLPEEPRQKVPGFIQ